MRSLKIVACVVSVVMAAGIALPAMAARSNSSSTAYFDAQGNFVGQSLYPCENKHFEGGDVTTPYTLTQIFGCYLGPPANGESGLEPNEVYSHPPPGITQEQLCLTLSRLGDPCGNPPGSIAPVFVWGR